jgi:hypothetical protein
MMADRFQLERILQTPSSVNVMQKIIFAFVAFAAVTLFAVSRGGNVDISGEVRGNSYADSAASAPVTVTAPPASNTAPAATGDITSTLAAKH